jgi:hypothetical protein
VLTRLEYQDRGRELDGWKAHISVHGRGLGPSSADGIAASKQMAKRQAADSLLRKLVGRP